MSPKAFVAVVGVILIVVGIIVLSMGISVASPNTGASLDCGAVLSSNVDQIRHDANVDALSDAMLGLPGAAQPMAGVQECEDALSTRSVIGWLVGGVGVLVLAGALLVRRPGELQQPASGLHT